MKKLLAVLTLLFVPLMLHAQNTGTLTGTVTDTETSKPIPGVNVVVEGTNKGSVTNAKGRYVVINIPPDTYTVRASFPGYADTTFKDITVEAGQKRTLDIQLLKGKSTDEVEVVYEQQLDLDTELDISRAAPVVRRDVSAYAAQPQRQALHHRRRAGRFNTEDYAHIEENAFRTARDNPLSTFAIDVDGAAYSNVRRFLTDGRQPPKGAVRIEEMVNYFDYNYPEPDGEHPFSITAEVGQPPWNTAHQLVHIGLQGRDVEKEHRPASNLVFLLDVSGSMNSPRKLPLLKEGFKMLTRELDERDRVAIVVYAGAAGLVLPSTPGDQKETILAAIDQLRAGGSTAGAEGIRQAYQEARNHYIEGGNNRVILATDGDFNVGVSSDAALVNLIEKKREQGTFLTVLGFGTGNLKDNKMEQIANHGNGSYYYIDGRTEAEKVLVSELAGTLYAIAKDVKIQVEFNPAAAKAYRLIGYENRMLAAEDFADDSTDAGELGAGHTVTALYEVIPVGAETSTNVRKQPDLKYQQHGMTDAALSDELLTVKLRYKQPDGDTSRLIEQPLVNPGPDAQARSDNFTFSAAVAAFGMVLRNSEHKGQATADMARSLAEDGLGDDREGYRAEFIELIERYQQLTGAERETAASR